MKFYYEGKLIRTSKTHIYTHAVINMETGALKGCRSSKETAENIITTAIHQNLEAIQNEHNILKAMKNGQKKYHCEEGRKSYYLPIDPKWTEETIHGFIKMNEDQIEYIKTNWKVVELEAK